MTHMFRNNFIALIVTGLFNIPATIAASTPPLFSSDEVLGLTLSVDFDSLCRPREVEDCGYSPTTLVYTSAKGEEHNIPVEIQVRGGWRSRTKHCKVPPLFVRFSAAETEGTPFAGQDLLPLTTHCRSNRDRKLHTAPGREYEQYVLKEFLGYRLFNTLSDKSLRVRLARISYNDPVEAKQSVTRYAFFTEHFDALAARQHTVKLPHKSFDHQKTDLKAFDTVALFQFMIGNTDWSVVRERNIILIATADGQQFPVPFDLDMAGLVNADYAGVSPRLSFRDVRQRLYLGFCHPDTDFKALFARFQAQKNTMLALVKEVPGLSRASRIDSKGYLKKFFAVLRSTKRRERDIVKACQPWPPAPDDHTTPPDDNAASS